MNTLKLIRLFVAGSTEKLWNAGQDAWWRLTVLLSVTLLFPMFLFLTGFGIAAYGEEHELQGIWGRWAALLVFGLVPAFFVVVLPVACLAVWRKSEAWLVAKGVIDPPAVARPINTPTPSEDDFFHAVEAQIEQQAAVRRQPSVAWPLVILFLILGVVAECVIRSGAIVTGQGLIVLSAFIAPLLFLAVLVRVHLIGALVILARGLVPESFKYFPSVPTKEMKEAGKGIAGAMAVLTFVCIIVQGLDVWRYPGYMLGALTAFLVLIFCAVAQWVSGALVKKVIVGVSAMRIALLVALMMSPRLEATMKEGANKGLGVPTDRSYVVLLREIRKERTEIKALAVSLCHGKFCGKVKVNGVERDASVERYELLGTWEEWLLKGEYWERINAPVKPVQSPAAPAPVTAQLEPQAAAQPQSQEVEVNYADLAPQ